VKIGISCQGDTLDSPLDERFGRASKFIIYDLDNNSFICIDNTQNLSSAQGAGVQAAQNVINAGAGVVITGNVGPKAFRALSAAEIEIYTASGLSVKEAIEKFKKGLLNKANSNNVEGHWI